MAVGKYLCNKCNRNYNIRDSGSYRTDFHIMLVLSIFVTVFIISIPLLVITAPLSCYFYYKSKKLDGKVYQCMHCRIPLVKTGSIEIEKEELLKEGL